MARSLGSSWSLKVGVVVVAAGLWYWGNAAKDARSLAAAAPRRGDLARVIREEARTRYRDTRVVAMPRTGRLLRHPVEEGDRVQAGQALAQLQTDLAKAALSAHTEELAAVDAELALVRDDRADRAALEGAVARRQASEAAVEARVEAIAERKAARELAAAELARVEDLAARGAATSSQLDSARSADARAQAALDVALRELTAARAEVRVALAAAAQARAGLDQLTLRVKRLVARRKALAARRAPLADDAQRTELVSPIAGEVLRVLHRSEAVLPAGTPVFEVGDPTTLEVEADVLSEDAVHLRPEGLYGVYGRALDGLEVPVRLREISPRAFTKRSSLGVEEQRVHAWFTFVRPPARLGHGYRVHLRAALEVARDAALIPRRALVRQGRGWGVFVAEGESAALRPVEPGVGDESWVALTRPLSPGTQLLLDVPETLEPGDPVSLRPAVDLPDPAPLPGTQDTGPGSDS
jgi:HlyD family secretion protein